MSWFLAEIPNRYFFVAAQDTRLIEVPKKQVNIFMEKNPDVLNLMLRRLVIGADGILKRLDVRMIGNAEDRILLELSILISRFGSHKDESVKSTMQKLAWQTGLSRETVSRTVKKLIESGKISYLNDTFVLSKK